MKITTLADATAALGLHLAKALPEYLPAVRDAQRGQPGAQRYGTRHALGHYADVTGDAGIARAEGEDVAANDEDAVYQHLKLARSHFRKAEQILQSYNSHIFISDRSAIGRCQETTCNTYCDGRDRRLTNYKGTGVMICTSCRSVRDRLAANTANTSAHVT